MKISKIFAGMSALAIAASMTIGASAFTVNGKGDDTGDWTNFIGDEFVTGDQFTEAGDYKVTIDFAVKDDTQGWAQINPFFFADGVEDGGWVTMCAKAGDYMVGGVLSEDDVEFDDDDVPNKPYYFQNTDGNLLIKDMECTTMEFTIPENVIKLIQDNNGGFGMNVYNVAINKVDFEPANGASSDPAPTAPATDPAPTDPAPTTPATPAATPTGASAGLALAGLALAGAAVVVSKKK